jgi:hypothetical protein
MRRSVNRDERGQVAVLFAIAAVALVAIVGLAVDAGTSYVDQRTLQAGSDTAATAGANMLAADFHACLASGGTPYSATDISKVVTTIAGAAVTASGSATAPPTLAYVLWNPGGTPQVLPYAGGDWCSDGAWTGPSGVTVGTVNSHHTILLQVVGVSQASEAATATVGFGVVPSGMVTPFVACATGSPSSVSPLDGYSLTPTGPGTPPTLAPNDYVLLAQKKGSTSWDTNCNHVQSSDFKGFLPCPPGSKPACTIKVTSGTTAGPFGGGSTCGQWPLLPVGTDIYVPMVSTVTGRGSSVELAVEGIIKVQIVYSNCSGSGDYNLIGRVEAVSGGLDGGILVCSTVESPLCSSPFTLSSADATVVRILS